jgi:hypothetical protein
VDFCGAWNAVALVAERKIAEAMAEGQFDNLPGRGRPQHLEDLSALPEDLRLAYILLKNSGHLEGSAESLKPANLGALTAGASGEARDLGKLERLKVYLAHARQPKSAGPDAETGPAPLEDISPEYVGKLLKKL